MKIYNIIRPVLFLFLLSTLVSCEDFLERYPSTSVSGEDIFSDLSTAEAGLIGLYNDLQSGDLAGRSTLLRGDMKSCDFYLLSGSGQYFAWEYNYRDNVTNYGSAGVIWAQGYQTIKDCNNFLEGVSSLEGDQERISDMAAQANTIKAIAYLELVKTFCYPPNLSKIDEKYSMGVPIVSNKQDNIDAIETGPTREPLSQVVAYIEELLNDALVGIDQSRQTGPFISKYAIYGILARVYLYQEKWQDAANAAIEASEGARMIDYDEYITTIRQDFNEECIFELMYTETDNLQDRMPGYIINQTVNDNNRNDASSKGYGEIGASDGFIALLKENPNDVRILLLHEDKLSTAPMDLEELIHGINGYSERYYYKHIGGKNGNVYLHNTPYIRLPEVLLIAAEAYSEIPGHDIESLSYLNQVYSKRTGTTLSDLVGDQLKEAIFDERRRELALEGHGIWDYLRKNKSFTRDPSHITVLTIDPTTDVGRNSEFFYKVVSPIPITEMDANPAMRDQQNPGYAPYQGSN